MAIKYHEESFDESFSDCSSEFKTTWIYLKDNGSFLIIFLELQSTSIGGVKTPGCYFSYQTHKIMLQLGCYT